MIQMLLDSNQNNSNQHSDKPVDSPKLPEIIQYAPKNTIDNNSNLGSRRGRNSKEKEEVIGGGARLQAASLRCPQISV